MTMCDDSHMKDIKLQTSINIFSFGKTDFVQIMLSE